MKNDVGGKLISLEDRREKVWTVIVFNHFSKELMGFLSNAATVENLQFTQRIIFNGVRNLKVLEIFSANFQGSHFCYPTNN
ncbi:hypothetical protein [Enterococcus casseliflavus]|uniref:hypothetical protein n=1 Tax=Enterococcus casseliflavus TaxID=37734 RepID=UPI002897DF16|nr:hypothetical protein [Enterococcus casseliflavus]